jgi:hypothetical protein
MYAYAPCVQVGTCTYTQAASQAHVLTCCDRKCSTAPVFSNSESESATCMDNMRVSMFRHVYVCRHRRIQHAPTRPCHAQQCRHVCIHPGMYVYHVSTMDAHTLAHTRSMDISPKMSCSQPSLSPAATMLGQQRYSTRTKPEQLLVVSCLDHAHPSRASCAQTCSAMHPVCHARAHAPTNAAVPLSLFSVCHT